MTFTIGNPTIIPTLGVEMEYQIVELASRQLSSDTESLLNEGAALFGDFIKPEFHAPVVECITTVCHTVSEVVEQCSELRRTVIGLAGKAGLGVVSASTHPSTHWKDVRLTPGERYLQITKDLGDVARSNLIYGMHCHVGIDDPEARIATLNASRYFLPHLLVLSSSSPFWQGRDTGFASVRSTIFARFPRTGLPETFENYAAYERYVSRLVETGCIDNAKKIWWDIRPHPFYPTVEFRVCDTPTRLDELLGITGFIQMMVTRFQNLYNRNMGYRLHRRAYVKENMYRAMRYGVHAKLIDLTIMKEVPAREMILAALDDWEPEARFLGLDKSVAAIHRILEQGSSADRQRKVYEDTGSFEAVIDHLLKETVEGC